MARVQSYNKTMFTDVVSCTTETCNGHGERIEVVGGGTACICTVGYTGTNCSMGE